MEVIEHLSEACGHDAGVPIARDVELSVAGGVTGDLQAAVGSSDELRPRLRYIECGERPRVEFQYQPLLLCRVRSTPRRPYEMYRQSPTELQRRSGRSSGAGRESRTTGRQAGRPNRAGLDRGETEGIRAGPASHSERVETPAKRGFLRTYSPKASTRSPDGI